ncbi:hypothetical protein WJX77_000298 [Trebouxia sp. C0004]
MTVKRSLSDDNQHHKAKRLCQDTGIHAAADNSISAQFRAESVLDNYSSWRGLSEQAWRCCAELNILLHLFKHMLGEVPLESYHSWTRASKAITHAKLRQHCEQQHEPGSQIQLQMVAHLLSSIIRDQPEAAISKYTFNLKHFCPEWLKSWCLRWGFTHGSVSILRLEAYSQSVPKLAGFDFLGYPVHVSRKRLSI